jgi:hypothetical protein
VFGCGGELFLLNTGGLVCDWCDTQSDSVCLWISYLGNEGDVTHYAFTLQLNHSKDIYVRGYRLSTIFF